MLLALLSSRSVYRLDIGGRGEAENAGSKDYCRSEAVKVHLSKAQKA